VVWPNGTTSVQTGVSANQVVGFDQAGGQITNVPTLGARELAILAILLAVVAVRLLGRS